MSTRPRWRPRYADTQGCPARRSSGCRMPPGDSGCWPWWCRPPRWPPSPTRWSRRWSSTAAGSSPAIGGPGCSSWSTSCPPGAAGSTTRRWTPGSAAAATPAASERAADTPSSGVWAVEQVTHVLGEDCERRFWGVKVLQEVRGETIGEGEQAGGSEVRIELGEDLPGLLAAPELVGEVVTQLPGAGDHVFGELWVGDRAAEPRHQCLNVDPLTCGQRQTLAQHDPDDLVRVARLREGRDLPGDPACEVLTDPLQSE